MPHIEEGLRDLFFQIEKEYHKLAGDRGTVIEEITKIERNEDIHFIFEDADFSTATIKNLIKQVEEDAENVLTGNKNNSNSRYSTCVPLPSQMAGCLFFHKY